MSKPAGGGRLYTKQVREGLVEVGSQEFWNKPD